MPEKKNLPSMYIMGIALRTRNGEEAMRDIPPHWQRFYEEQIFEKIPHKRSGDIIALYCDYESDYTQPYTLVIGCEVTSAVEVPQGMVVKQLPTSVYAVYNVVGPLPQSLIETWQTIWKSDLKRTYTGDFQVHRPSKEVDVFVAIKP
jgi:predicted transcriptional regulator YdeE